MKSKLCFDASTDVDNVGAWVRAGTDGDRIASQTIAAEEWLNVASALHDGSGTALTSTLVGSDQALDVNIVNEIAVELDGVYDGVSNTNPDNVGNIFHVRAAAPDDTDQTFRSTGGDGYTAIASGDISDIHGIDTYSYLYAIDDTSGDADPLTRDATSGGLNVHLAGSDIELDIDDTADTACDFTATSVDDTVGGTDLRATDLADRKYFFAYNNGTETVYLGESGVTTATGFPLDPCAYIMMRAGASCDLYAIAPSGTQDIRIAELA